MTLGVAGSDDVRTLKVPRVAPDEWQWRPVPRSTSTPTADAMRERRTIELHGRDRVREVYPPELEQLLAGVASMLVVPFPRATGAVGVAFREDRALTADERRMLEEIAEELTRALERATLLERERDARLHAELLERHAARLAAATTDTEVASATVSEIEAVGADVVFAWTLGEGEQLEALASSSVPDETRRRLGSTRSTCAGSSRCDESALADRDRLRRRVRRPLPRAGGGAAKARRRVTCRPASPKRARRGHRRDLGDLAARGLGDR